MLVRTVHGGRELPQPLLMAVEKALTPVLEFALGRWTPEATSQALHKGMTPAQVDAMSQWLLANRDKALDPLMEVRGGSLLASLIR